MSASTIPYHLRPHKSVDRRLFVDLLTRYERWRPIIDYAYISMGAYALEDHKMIHRRFGITRLVSFDRSASTVARQTFNRPVGTCRCLKVSSGQLIERLDDIINASQEGAPAGIVIWLDYTDPSGLGEQIREFQILLAKLAEGDVVRITVNAHAPALGAARRSDGTFVTNEAILKNRFARLEERIGDFLPSDASPAGVSETELPRLIARAFGQAAMKAVPPEGGLTFSPLSIISYADGQRMVSITGVLVKMKCEGLMRSRIGLGQWPFKSDDWSAVADLKVPDLTVRERMFLEQSMDLSPDEVAKGLGFRFGGGIEVSDFVKNYRSYYRFYPSLIATEV